MNWVDMGLGKTVCQLTAIQRLQQRIDIYGTLVVAPLRVCQSVWRQEAAKWSHLRGQFKFALITGTKEERERALFSRADIYLINYNNLPWLVQELNQRWLGKGRYPPFNNLVFDEVSKMKSSRVKEGGKWGQAAWQILSYMKRRSGLTGTPASNGLTDLFGQFLMIDQGARLGTSYTDYERKFFYYPDQYSHRPLPMPGADEAIRSLVGDITISMNSDDYLDLPPLLTNDVWVDMSEAKQKQYKSMEREMLLEFDSGHELDIHNAASLVNRCLQFANGACYMKPDNPQWENIHDLKIEALQDAVSEAQGKPVLVMYEFIHDAEKILKKFKHAVRIHSQINESDFNKLVEDWNAGSIQMLIGHPASIGHGLNIQAGSNHLVWYGLNWSLDLYQQAIARLRRQGQTLPVNMTRILTRNTLDEAVMIALESKAAEEKGIRQAIEQYRRAA